MSAPISVIDQILNNIRNRNQNGGGLPSPDSDNMLISDADGITGQPLVNSNTPGAGVGDADSADMSAGLMTDNTNVPPSTTPANTDTSRMPTPQIKAPQPSDSVPGALGVTQQMLNQPPPPINPAQLASPAPAASAGGPPPPVNPASVAQPQGPPPAVTPQQLINQSYQGMQAAPPPPKSIWRQLAASALQAAPIVGPILGRTQIPADIAYGTQGAQQLQQYLRQQGNLPGMEKLANTATTLQDANARLAETTTNQEALRDQKAANAYQKFKEDLDKNMGIPYQVGQPIPKDWTPGWRIESALNPNTGKTETYAVPNPADAVRIKAQNEAAQKQAGYIPVPPSLKSVLGPGAPDKMDPAQIVTLLDTQARISQAAAQQADNLELRKQLMDQTQQFRNSELDIRRQMAGQSATNSATAKSNQSYQFNTRELDTLATPVRQLQARMVNLQSSLDQNSPQADALIAPQLLSIMSGGQGSGLRMNETEISRIVGGRSKWQSLQAAANQWSLDPSKANSITPEQRTQIRALMTEVQKRVQKQATAINQGYQDLAGTDDANQHRQIVNRVRTSLSGPVATPRNQAEYDALPSGTAYIDPQGNQGVKR